MRAKSPFFTGFHKLLGGRKPASPMEKLLGLRGKVDGLCATQLTALFGAFLPADLLTRKSAAGVGSRERIFSRAVTFWTFLSQVLDPESSCRKAVARVQTLFALKGLQRPSQVTGAYCQARLRLPVRWLVSILEHITGRLTLGQHGEGRLLVADGTSVALPDTLALQARYPQPGGQKPGCGFPVMKLLALFDLRSGAWLATTHSWRKAHDCRLWRRLFWRLGKGDTIIVDRAFCSWFDLARLMAREVDVVVRLHQARTADFRKGRRLGKDDQLASWKKPPCPPWMSQHEYDTLPAAITVREVRQRLESKGRRTRELIVVSTLLDVAKHSAQDVVALYARRWRVELNFDDLKTTMRMEMMRTKSPAMICRELLLHMIAYNLLRALMARAEVSVEKASFKGTVDRLSTWSWAIWLAPTRQQARSRVEELLQSIAADKVPHRPHRQEPRAVKRRPKPYALLNAPRHSMKEIPHRSRYRKAA